MNSKHAENYDAKQDTGKFRTNMRDKFYTNKDVAKSCVKSIIDIVPFTENYLWIEPSAGNGSFLHNIPFAIEKIGLDLEPMANDIQKQDFLTWTPPLTDRKIIVFGNPPFGRQSSLAKVFITKSCKFADVIAFILPRSFTKPSMFNVFATKFHLIHTEELEKNSFVINESSKYDVPCVFQIWHKKEIDRTMDKKICPSGFRYVKDDNNYDVAFRRVGGLAGKCYQKNETKKFSGQSHHFLKFDDNFLPHVDTIVTKINEHTFPSNTAFLIHTKKV